MQGREPMRSTWVGGCGLGMILALAAGCRTMPPELKPPKQPEVLAVPPSEARYNTSIYPKEAFATPDLFKQKEANPIMPTRGMGGQGLNPAMMNQQGRGPMQ